MLGHKPRVLLVTSPYHSGVVESAGTWMPLAMVYVAGEARVAGAEVEIYDARGHRAQDRRVQAGHRGNHRHHRHGARRPGDLRHRQGVEPGGPHGDRQRARDLLLGRDPPRRPERGLRGSRRGGGHHRRAGEGGGGGGGVRAHRRPRLSQGWNPGLQSQAHAGARPGSVPAGLGPRRLADLLVPAEP
jgi:hypothetical protein